MNHNSNKHPSKPSHSTARVPASQVSFWRTTAIAALLLAGVLAFMNWMVRSPRPSEPVKDTGENSRPGAPTTGSASPLTTWGRLETEQVFLERPDQHFSNANAYFEARPPWHFGKTPLESVQALLDTAGLDASARNWLLERRNWTTESEGLEIAPPNDLLFNLTPAARGKIYSFLGQIPGNPLKNDPFKIATNLAPMWFVDSGVAVETERLIRSLTYQRGPMLCFSDVGLLAGQVSAADRPRVLKALSRMPVQRAFLRIEHGDELGAVTNYWSPGGRVGSILPLLDSLRHSPEGGRIDLSYLLPRFCSERLYTFPDPATTPHADVVDCFWTALNFFRHPPEQRFLDVPHRLRYLQDNYDEVAGEPALGDIMTLHNVGQEPVHACVYVAGDGVFTKNGATLFSPWVLMAYQDMLAYYSMDGEPTLRIHRARRRPNN